jgi:hypothetical protein
MESADLKMICITARSGICLFCAEYDGAGRNTQMIGALLRAVNALAFQSVGASVSTIMMSHVGITVAQSEETGVQCVIFHGVNYFSSLARSIASQILRVFIDRYDAKELTGADTQIFRRFNGSLGPAIRSAANPILHNLVTKLRGAVQFAMIFCDGDTRYTYPSNLYSIRVAANLQQLQFTLQEMANLTGDSPSELVIEGGQIFSHVVFFGSATVVVIQIKAQSHSPEVVGQVKESLSMLELCFKTTEDLMG